MAIVKVQSITGSGTTIVLSGVAAGNLLTLQTSYFRAVPTANAEPVPTDSQGTWSIAAAGIPGVIAGSFNAGASIFYQANVAAGTHTVTPQANDSRQWTLVEWSGIQTASPLDGTNTAKTDSSTFNSQVTGTTATTAQADELVLITIGLSALTGAANVGFTDPVSGFTTLLIHSDDTATTAADIGALQSYKIISSIGTQSATFNWTDPEGSQFAGAAIATFKAVAASGSSPSPMYYSRKIFFPV